MKNFKKFLALACAGIMAAGLLAGCGSGSASTAATTAAAGEGETTEHEVQTLHMVTEATFPPYEFYEGNEIVGIDVDIAQAIADELGFTLVVEDMAFDSLIMAVSSGKADIAAAGMTVTEEIGRASCRERV